MVALALGGRPAIAAPTWAALTDPPALQEPLPGSINPPANPAASGADLARLVQRSIADMNPPDRAAELPTGPEDTSFKATFAVPELSQGITRPVLSSSRAPEMIDRPMAPLPPAVVAGPIGIALAGFIAWRAKRRGGRI